MTHQVRANLAADDEGHPLAVRTDRTAIGVTPGRGPTREHG